MRKTRRSNTRRRQTKRGGKFQMKVKNSCNNTGKDRTKVSVSKVATAEDKKRECTVEKGKCWKEGRPGKSEAWCYEPFSDKFNVIIKK